jgi:DNA repair exonuclease SbcCD ATPase subunit
MREQLNHLRAVLAQTQNELIEAEAELADRLAEVAAFEVEFEARVGHLLDSLEALEQEIERYNERIQIARNKAVLGYAHLPVEQQYRRAWRASRSPGPTPPSTPVSPASEAEIKRLYRLLARRFHPDLAQSEADRLVRTQKMAIINDAYAARSLAELIALAQGIDTIETGQERPGQTEAQLIEALQAELQRRRRRLREIEHELKNLHHRSSVELSLEVKAARRQGRDLLAEMAGDYERRIARKSAERDMLKAQFDQLGPEQGFINIGR